MSTTPRTDESTIEAFCRFDQGGICDAETRGQRDGRFVEADFARQLETELSSLQLELGATKGELNEAKAEIERMKTRDMWLSGLSDDIQDVRGKLVESQAREAQLREALESIAEYWNHAPESAVDAIETAEGLAADALSQPAPPVVPLADVKPLLEALDQIITPMSKRIRDDYSIANEALSTFTAKHPDLKP